LLPGKQMVRWISTPEGWQIPARGCCINAHR
jgi:hypothetical protein